MCIAGPMMMGTIARNGQATRTFSIAQRMTTDPVKPMNHRAWIRSKEERLPSMGSTRSRVLGSGGARAGLATTWGANPAVASLRLQEHRAACQIPRPNADGVRIRRAWCLPKEHDIHRVAQDIDTDPYRFSVLWLRSKLSSCSYQSAILAILLSSPRTVRSQRLTFILYDLEGTESPRELDTIFHAMKFLMSFSFTAAEELREVAEREAVLMAEKEEAWEEQKIALKEELDTLRERITVSAEAGDSTEAFRAQIDSLREENRELEKTNRDRDREMADLRDRFESLVSRADMLTRERDALEQHRNQMEDTIRELQRRISAKSEETTNEWESRKLRQRNEQAVTLTKQMHAVVLQNDELREEVTRVGDALEEATRIIKESSTRYAELTAQHDATRRDLRAISEENAIMREKLEASSTMLATVETEAMDVEQSTAAKLREMNNRNRELREELYATQRELEEIRQLADSMNHEEKEAELEKLRSELIEATKTARSLYGELTSKSSTDPTVAFQLRIMQLESHLEQSNEKIAAQKKALEELEDTLVSKDKLHGEIAAELERLREVGRITAA
ncbi:hypothetical protein RB195_006202 [Necator americanus]|uniref:M protein repeat protein n=1 Tax=Necator americanus TaxID=51031 RepID=A0ABR1BRG4_NECAM